MSKHTCGDCQAFERRYWQWLRDGLCTSNNKAVNRDDPACEMHSELAGSEREGEVQAMDRNLDAVMRRRSDESIQRMIAYWRQLRDQHQEMQQHCELEIARFEAEQKRRREEASGA